MLTSFRLVIKQEEKDREKLQLGAGLPAGGGASGGLGAAVAFVAVNGAILAAEGALILGKAGTEEVIRGRRERRGPPYNLSRQYSSGVTCDVKARAILEWNDGQRSETEISAVVNPTSYVERTTSAHVVEVHQAIHEAMDRLAQDWIRKNPRK